MKSKNVTIRLKSLEPPVGLAEHFFVVPSFFLYKSHLKIIEQSTGDDYCGTPSNPEFDVRAKTYRTVTSRHIWPFLRRISDAYRNAYIRLFCQNYFYVVFEIYLLIWQIVVTETSLKIIKAAVHTRIAVVVWVKVNRVFRSIESRYSFGERPFFVRINGDRFFFFYFSFQYPNLKCYSFLTIWVRRQDARN